VKEGRRLGLWESLKDAALERLVRNKVRGRFGGRLKAFVSGGAALNPDIGWFFQALGLNLLQGYGQTESAPVVSANRPGKIKMPSVGPAVKGVTVRIAEDGEILVRGELVMQGYWQDPEGTARAIQDGWLHTGDIGHLDEDGYIFITDRKKDILVLSGGDNVSPARIEGRLTLEPEIEQAMVYGDRKPNLVALIVPSRDFTQAHADPVRAHEAMGKVLDRVNRELSVIEKVRRFALAPEPFSTENEMLTPTMKIRRHKIKAAYGALLEGLYERKG
jgi:long-chain acyl-CoA synthetase